jgi:hypothetical protein
MSHLEQRQVAKVMLSGASCVSIEKRGVQSGSKEEGNSLLSKIKSSSPQCDRSKPA